MGNSQGYARAFLHDRGGTADTDPWSVGAGVSSASGATASGRSGGRKSAAAASQGRRACAYMQAAQPLTLLPGLMHFGLGLPAPSILGSLCLLGVRMGAPMVTYLVVALAGKVLCAVATASVVFYAVTKVNLGSAPRHCAKLLLDGVDEDGKEVRTPEWLDVRRLNWAVTGTGGVGKSSLINAIRGIRSAREPGAARTGVVETTLKPTEYRFDCAVYPFSAVANLDSVSLWDLPGSDTPAFPRETYLQRMGLRYFDGVLVISGDRFSETDMLLCREMEACGVPYYLVRNKVDAAVVNNWADWRRPKGDTIGELRSEFRVQLRAAGLRHGALAREPSAAGPRGVLGAFAATVAERATSLGGAVAGRAWRWAWGQDEARRDEGEEDEGADDKDVSHTPVPASRPWTPGGAMIAPTPSTAAPSAPPAGRTASLLRASGAARANAEPSTASDDGRYSDGQGGDETARLLAAELAGSSCSSSAPSLCDASDAGDETGCAVGPPQAATPCCDAAALGAVRSLTATRDVYLVSARTVLEDADFHADGSGDDEEEEADVYGGSRAYPEWRGGSSGKAAQWPTLSAKAAQDAAECVEGDRFDIDRLLGDIVLDLLQSRKFLV